MTEPNTPTPETPDLGPIEPDLTDPNAQDAAPAAPKPADKPEKQAEDVELEQAYKSDPRNAIYAKRSGDLKAQEEADKDVFPAMSEDEDEPPASDEGIPPQEPVAAVGKSVKIKVYGEEREVPESEVIRAGVATLQKDAAADVRLAQAAQKEAALRSQEERILRATENLRKGLDVNGQPLATNPQPPAKGVAGSRTIDKGVLEGAVKALYSGDTEEATQALQNVFSAMQSSQGTPNQIDPEVVKSVEDAVLARMSARESAGRDETDRLEANRIFREDFKEISTNPDAFAMARGLVAKLAEDPVWQNKSRAEVAREVGTRIRKLSGQSGDPLADRRGMKRGMSPTPTASGRMPAPAPDRFPSNQDYIAQLRANSGSNSVR